MRPRKEDRVLSLSDLALSLLLSVLVTFVLGCNPRAAEARSPNIVLIVADDLGWGDLGVYGHRRLSTPSLDRLAAEGSLLTEAYAASPVCSPSRAAILTGRNPSELGIHTIFSTKARNLEHGIPDQLDPSLTTLPDLLRGGGYQTGHYGKWHLGTGTQMAEPGEYGYDEWRVVDNRDPEFNLLHPEQRASSSARIIDETIGFIERNQNGPFFVNVWLLDPHGTLNPTPEQMEPYRDLGPTDVPFRGSTEVYYAAVTDADRQIGRLLDRLEALELDQDTLVIFTSDNGPEVFEVPNASHSAVGSAGPFRGYKRSLYEGGIRAPFIARWPGRTPAGRVDRDTVLSGIDLLPTLVAAAGVDWPEALSLDGEDLSAALLGRSAQRSHPLVWQRRFAIVGHPIHRSPSMAVRDGRWKLLMNRDGKRVELYDLETDPSEVDNVAAENPAVVERLSKLLTEWQASLPEGPWAPSAGRNRYPWPR